MDNNARYYLYILLAIANFRKETISNLETIGITQDRVINLGAIDLLESFIAYICLSNKRKSIIDKRIENARGVFVPSIRSTIRYLPGTIIRDNDGNTVVYLLESAYDRIREIEQVLREEINSRDDQFLPTVSLDTFVRKFYPQNGNKKREDEVQVWVRVASCFWTCGKENTGMQEEDLRDCYKYHWKKLKSQKIKELVNAEILEKKGNKFILRSVGAPREACLLPS